MGLTGGASGVDGRRLRAGRVYMGIGLGVGGRRQPDALNEWEIMDQPKETLVLMNDDDGLSGWVGLNY